MTRTITGRRARLASVVTLAVWGALLWGCSGNDGRVARGERSAEPEPVPSRVPLFLGEPSAGQLIVLAPFYRDRAREIFTRERIAARLGLDPQTGQLAALWVICYPGSAGDLSLPIDRAIVVGQSDTGEYANRVLCQNEAVLADPLLRALVLLRDGQRVVHEGTAGRFLLWLPGNSIEELRTAEVRLADRTVPLRSVRAPAEAWEHFHDDLDRDALLASLEAAVLANGEPK